MKYKIGDEVFVRCKIINVYPGSTVPYEAISANCNPGFAKPLYIAVRDDDIEDMTIEEAWELARRIVGCREHGLEETKRREIFSRDDAFDVFNLFSAKEAKAKIEAWEAKKEIKVGDEVAPKSDPNSNECKFVVTIKDDEDGTISGFSVFGGDVFSGRDINQYQKTGRHIDIDEVLKQIGGSDA